eukprot:124873_1
MHLAFKNNVNNAPNKLSYPLNNTHRQMSAQMMQQIINNQSQISNTQQQQIINRSLSENNSGSVNSNYCPTNNNNNNLGLKNNVNNAHGQICAKMMQQIINNQ